MATFTVGQTVNVAPRTTPGINKHGGVGFVEKIHPDGKVDVKYVLGGKEKELEVCYVTAEDENKPSRRRGKEKENLTPITAYSISKETSTTKVNMSKPSSQKPRDTTTLKSSKHKSTMSKQKDNHAKCAPSKPAPAKKQQSKYSVGLTVEVAARTQPGMNKPGGTARITKVNDNGTYNVAYVLGGSEKNLAEMLLKLCDLEQPSSRVRKPTTQFEIPDDQPKQQRKKIKQSPPGSSSVVRIAKKKTEKSMPLHYSSMPIRLNTSSLKPKQNFLKKSPMSLGFVKPFEEKKILPTEVIKPKPIVTKTREEIQKGVADQERQNEFRQAVSKEFHDRSTTSLDKAILKDAVQKTISELDDAEYAKRLKKLDDEDRILLGDDNKTIHLVC